MDHLTALLLLFPCLAIAYVLGYASGIKDAEKPGGGWF